MPLFSSLTRFKKGLKGDGWATPEYYGAKGIDGVNDLPAFQAAATDLGQNGGKLLLGPKVYQLDGLLNWPVNVSWRGAGDATFINWNHATANQLVFASSNHGGPITFEDVRFIGKIGATGTCITNNANARVSFKRCAWNGYAPGAALSANLQGKIASINSADSQLTFEDCQISVAGILKGLHAQQGYIRVVRGKMTMPATYSEALAQNEVGGTITLDNVRVDLNAHTTGVAYALFANTANTDDFAAMRGCEIEGALAVGTQTAFYWIPDALVVMTSNRVSSGVSPFGQNSAPGARSIVELRPYAQQDFSTSASIDLRSTYGYRTHLVRNDASVVSIILPAGVIDGQELCFIYDSETIVTAGNLTFATTKISAAAVPTVGAGNTLTGHFRWARREATGDSDRWIQIGGWSVGGILV